jgi:hypothetical protein
MLVRLPEDLQHKDYYIYTNSIANISNTRLIILMF